MLISLSYFRNSIFFIGKREILAGNKHTSQFCIAFLLTRIFFTRRKQANFWGDIDYMLVARSALHVGAHCTALLYVELWCETHFDSVMMPSLEPNDQQHQEENEGADEGSEEGTKGGVRSLLLDIFVSIGESDAFYGNHLLLFLANFGSLLIANLIIHILY